MRALMRGQEALAGGEDEVGDPDVAVEGGSGEGAAFLVG